jgi:hypothetical protein
MSGVAEIVEVARLGELEEIPQLVRVRLTFADGRTEVRQIGLDGVPRVSPNGRYGLPVAVRGLWQDAHSFVLDYDEVANINDFRFTLNFHEKVATINLYERTADVTVSFEGTMKVN